ncbi:cytochrome P450 [Dactylosporangium sp. NPDC000555]|uniref:cytochrome P450 n=1 Tax=Dactylosporangium sp. NPDC000555 TaxID=3154260 RepID=UPI00331C1E20
MTQDMTPVALAGPEHEPFGFPMQRDCPFHPPARYETLRAERPIVPVRVPDGQVAWLVTRYADVRALLTDPRVSSDRTHPNLPLTESVTPQTRRNIAEVGRSLIGLDRAEHGPQRRMLITEFTLRRAQELRPHIQQTVDRAIDAMLAGPQPADLVDALAVPVPSATVTKLLGMPYEDRELIERAANAQLRQSVPAQERQETSAELHAYVDRLISAKEANPTDDVLGRLIRRNRQTPLFDHEMLVGLTMLLLVAGFETTASMIALGSAWLLSNERERAAIVADPAAAGPAVEELLRYFSVVDALPRIATDDIEIGGVRIRAGDGILISFASANWDDAAFADAATVDIGRNARHHVAFGYGIHQCIGQNLAREELQIVFRTLFTRVPTLRLVGDVAGLPFKNDSNIYGVDRVPVTW